MTKPDIDKLIHCPHDVKCMCCKDMMSYNLCKYCTKECKCERKNES